MRKMISLFTLVFVLFLASCSGPKQEVLTDPEIDGSQINVELGHAGNMSAVTFSPDGKYVASSSYDYRIIIWDYQTGHQVMAINPQSSDDALNYMSLNYTSDGTKLLAGGYGQVDIYNVADGSLLKSVEVYGFDGKSLAISPDDKFFAIDGDDDNAFLYSIDAGTSSVTFEGHTGSIYKLAFSPDGKMLASASYDSTVIVWDVETGDAVKTIQENNEINYIAFNNTSNIFAYSVDDEDQTHVWDADAMKELNVIDEEAEYIVFMGDNLLLREYSDIKEINIETGEEIMSIDDYGYKLAVSSDNAHIAGVSSRGVTVFDASTGNVVNEFGKDTRMALKLHVSASGKFIVAECNHKSGSGGPDILSFAVDTTNGFTAYPTSGSGCNSMSFRGNEDVIFAEEYYGEAYYYNLASGQSISKIEDKVTEPFNITSDGKLLIAEDKEESDSYAIFDAATGDKIKELVNTDAYLYFTGITPDDKYYVILTMDFFKVFELPSGNEVKSFDREDMDDIVFVDQLSDGKYVVGRASYDGFSLCDMMTGEVVFFVKDINAKSAALNSDKNTVAIACDDWTVKIFDIAQNAQTQTLKSHTAVLKSVTYTPDGKYLISSAADNQIKVWDLQGTLVLTIVGLEKLSDYDGETKDWVAFAPNGRYDGTQAGIDKFLYFDKAGERVPASTYKDQCYTKNLIGRTLGQNFIEVAVAE